MAFALLRFTLTLTITPSGGSRSSASPPPPSLGGAAATVPVGAESEETDWPCVAVTRTRTVEPASAAVSVYVDPVAPSIGAQFPPLSSQRRQEWESAGVPVQVPSAAVSVSPSAGVPLTVGRAVANGVFAPTLTSYPLHAPPDGPWLTTTSRRSPAPIGTDAELGPAGSAPELPA